MDRTHVWEKLERWIVYTSAHQKLTRQLARKESSPLPILIRRAGLNRKRDCSSRQKSAFPSDLVAPEWNLLPFAPAPTSRVWLSCGRQPNLSFLFGYITKEGTIIWDLIMNNGFQQEVYPSLKSTIRQHKEKLGTLKEKKKEKKTRVKLV